MSPGCEYVNSCFVKFMYHFLISKNTEVSDSTDFLGHCNNELSFSVVGYKRK